MRIMEYSQRIQSPPGHLWREQVQARVRRLLQENRPDWQTIGKEDWLTRKAEWKRFVDCKMECIHNAPRSSGPAEILEEKVYDGFRVQKIVIETFPGRQIGLNLFLPQVEGPYVPVLCPCGHGPKWQDDHQIPPQVLARNGFAAALFDMPMFGERGMDNDHFIQGAQSLMIGLWSNFFFLIDPVRVADYLEARDDIDVSRGMGVTGVSGGGLATLFMAQADSRVSVIVPVCCTTPFGAHILDGLYTGCLENYMEGQAAVGLDLHHLLALAAPRPCLVIGGSEDTLFRRESVERAMADARTAYALEGAAERIELFFDDCAHKYSVRMANETARWSRRWLMEDDAGTAVIKEVQLLSQEELDCGTSETTDGMLQVIQRESKRLRAVRTSQMDSDALRSVLGVDSQPVPADVEEIPARTEWGADGLRRLVLHAEEDLPLPVLEMKSPEAAAGTVLCLSDRGKLSVLRQAGGLGSLRRRMLAADIRGFGELEPEPSDYDIHGFCSIDRVLDDLLFLCGEIPMSQQVRDVLRAIDYAMKSGADPDGLILYGEGEAALPALFAGLLHEKVKRIVLSNFLCSFEALATATAPVWKRYSFLRHVLEKFDLPEILRARVDKKLLLINPCDARKERLDEIEALDLYGALDEEHLTVHVAYDNCDVPGIIREWLDQAERQPEQPVRSRPLPTKMLGADLTGLSELRKVREAIATKTLFRHYGAGKPVMAETLERRMRETFGCRYALAVSSGSAALFCALAGIGPGPGDEVVMPAFGWYSDYNAVVLHGALPVFCDIDRSLNLDPEDFGRKITDRTKAVIVIHYQGGPARMDEIFAIARARGIRIVEDCAQGIGAKYKERYCGTIGDVGIFSFQGNKVLTAGEGGMVLTNDTSIFERAVQYHDLGFLRPTFEAQLDCSPQTAEFVGAQYRMNELTAAVMLAQLDRFEWMLGRCRGAWDRIRNKVLAAIPDFAFRVTGCDEGDAGITLFLDLGTPEKAARFSEALAAEGISPGPSSGMTNLLHADYVLQKRMPNPALPPFGKGYNGEAVVYEPAQTPQTDPIIAGMVPIGIGPRFTMQDADDIARAIVKGHSRVL